MADMKYEDATPVDEPVARPKQKAKPAPPKDKKSRMDTSNRRGMNAMYEESEKLKSSPVGGLDLTESEPNPANSYSPSSYAKGGSASSRADGCAQRGKTRGMML